MTFSTSADELGRLFKRTSHQPRKDEHKVNTDKFSGLDAFVINPQKITVIKLKGYDFEIQHVAINATGKWCPDRNSGSNKPWGMSSGKWNGYPKGCLIVEWKIGREVKFRNYPRPKEANNVSFHTQGCYNVTIWLYMNDKRMHSSEFENNNKWGNEPMKVQINWKSYNK